MSPERPFPGSEVPLQAGRMTQGIGRRGGQVLRPTGPWSEAVHEHLRHLEAAGFDGAPRFLGLEGHREVLTFIDGDVPVDPDWRPGTVQRLPAYARSEAALVATAALVRQLHDAARGFRPTSTEYRFVPHPPRQGELVSHGDLGPWNTVYRSGVPVGFIDWDAAGPVDPLVDLAAAAWEFVPLAPPEQLRAAGFDPVPDIAARLWLFVGAYGPVDRSVMVAALQQSRLLAAERIKHAPVDAAEAAEALEHVSRELRWLHSVRSHLSR
ncbi:Phosphotransferase enzyme family protein [Micromonospora sediminicola]|uniref:Phosphotransferase enzyme family protein n=2 Tax=Micromonospora sediminicola TaxID=946078 RepID=A0A1A9BH66_9ACTN|nr:Phosphotransferase enzyme family protein [Micromonospora sediminicola]